MQEWLKESVNADLESWRAIWVASPWRKKQIARIGLLGGRQDDSNSRVLESFSRRRAPVVIDSLVHID